MVDTKKETIAEQHVKIRKECKAAVKGPGKFEGEAIYVPYVYDVYLDGGLDFDDGEQFGILLRAEDKLIFPELEGRRSVRLFETLDGFIFTCCSAIVSFFVSTIFKTSYKTGTENTKSEHYILPHPQKIFKYP